MACRAHEILERLKEHRRNFLSLREGARILGLSTHALRTWLQRGHVARSGVRRQFAKEELGRLVRWLADRAEPFGPEDYLARIYRHRGGPAFQFQKLGAARFAWPKDRTALRPAELARLVDCHPSLILQAIRQQTVRGRRPTPCRWEITRRAWEDAFPSSVLRVQRLPPLPKGERISTAEAAAHLQACGLAGASPEFVRSLIKQGTLQAVKPTPGGRRLFVLKSSLVAYRKIFKKTS